MLTCSHARMNLLTFVMSDNSTKVRNLVDISKLPSVEEAQEFIDSIVDWEFCRINKDGEIVRMKGPLVQMANGIRHSIKGNKGSIPTDIDSLVLQNDEKLVLACLSMFPEFNLFYLPTAGKGFIKERNRKKIAKRKHAELEEEEDEEEEEEEEEEEKPEPKLKKIKKVEPEPKSKSKSKSKSKPKPKPNILQCEECNNVLTSAQKNTVRNKGYPFCTQKCKINNEKKKRGEEVNK